MPNFTTIFLDRDGVINRKQPEDDYVTCWQRFEFLPRAVAAIALLHAAGRRVIVVTNQRGIARGRMSVAEVQEIHRRMQEELARRGARIDGIYVCPHDYGECTCRKPAVGLFRQAQADFPAIDFAYAAIIGDSLSDLLPARELGSAAVLVADPARQAELLPVIAAQGLSLYGVADNLYTAVVRIILNDEVRA